MNIIPKTIKVDTCTGALFILIMFLCQVVISVLILWRCGGG